MRDVVVSMLGGDHQEQTFTTEASSLFDACRQAIKTWAQYWWFDPMALLTVRVGDQRWYVRQDVVRGRKKL
jgi:hypothetical protein